MTPHLNEALLSQPLLNEKEAAFLLQVSIRTLQKWRFQTPRRGPRFRRMEGLIRYAKPDLLAFLESEKVVSAN